MKTGDKRFCVRVRSRQNLELENQFKNGKVNDVLEQLSKCYTSKIGIAKYMESETQEIRECTIIEFGFPVQVEVIFYL